MIFKNADYQSLANDIISKNKKIAVYGAGMIGQIVIPYLIREYGLHDHLLFFMDADSKKQEDSIQIGDRRYAVRGPEELRKLPSNTIVLVTNSNYAPIVKMMDEMKELDDTEGYIVPILQVLHTHVKTEKYVLKTGEQPLIPKKIHYCWFSRNPMPEYLLRCIDSWHKFCPDYEIIRWDEDNYDVGKNPYMRQAYEAKKWGFVPDVARLDILYEHGGIYMDTDVELIKSLDALLYMPAFAGVEKWGNINMGGCSGAVPHHPLIKKMLDGRIHERFILEDGSLNQTTCGYYETKPLIDIGMKPNNTIQHLADMTVLSSEFFHPYDYMSGETRITANTFSIHHFNGGWLDAKRVEERKKTTELYNRMLKRMQVE